jgi:hypothetical protein
MGFRRFSTLPEWKPPTEYTQKPTRPGSPEIVFTITAGTLMANPPGARIVCAWEKDRKLSRVTLHNATTGEEVCTFLVEPPPDADGRTITTESMELAAAVYWSWWRGSVATPEELRATEGGAK